MKNNKQHKKHSPYQPRSQKIRLFSFGVIVLLVLGGGVVVMGLLILATV